MYMYVYARRALRGGGGHGGEGACVGKCAYACVSAMRVRGLSGCRRRHRAHE